MFERIANSWQLVKASAAVLRADKELVIFPIVSAIGVSLVTLSFFVPMILAGFIDSFIAGDGRIAGYIVLFLFYLVTYFVTFFANSALVGAALIRLDGGDPTLSDGFRLALARTGPLLGYAAIAATVGLILRTLSERQEGLGRFVVGLVGFAWNVATFLVVPVLVEEKVGPVDAIRRSATLLKQTWGEQIAGNFTVGLIFGLLTVLVFLLGVPLIFFTAATTQATGLIIAAVLLVVFTLIALGLANATLSGIYTAAVYRYAVTGQSGDFFAPELVEKAFKRR